MGHEAADTPDRLAEAEAARRDRRYAEAIRLYGQILEVKPRHRAALKGLADAQRGLRDYEACHATWMCYVQA